MQRGPWDRDVVLDPTGKPPEVHIRTDHALNWEPEINQVAIRGDVHALQVLEHRRTAVPGHLI